MRYAVLMEGKGCSKSYEALKKAAESVEIAKKAVEEEKEGENE